MSEQEKKKIKLVIYSVISILVVMVFIYIRIVLGKADPIDFTGGTAFGIIIAVIIYGLKREYEEFKNVSKLKNQNV